MQVAPSPAATMARAPDTTIHVAWAAGGQVFARDPATRTDVLVGAGDGRPALIAGAGGLRLLVGGLSGASSDGVSWQVGPNAATGSVSAIALPDGNVLQAWVQEGVVRVGTTAYGAGAAPALAPGMVAWVAADGVRVQPINDDGSPAGPASLVPGGSGEPSIVARGGEHFVAAGSVVWRVGSPATLAVQGTQAALAVDPRGRLWVAWADAQKVLAARSDRDVSELGAPVALGFTTVTGLQVSATKTAAHVLVTGTGAYLTRVLPGLTLQERHRREIFTFSVTDAGEPVRGAVVKVRGRSGKTDRNGRVTLRVSGRKARVTATLKGYTSARLTTK